MELRSIKQEEYSRAKHVWEMCFEGDKGAFSDYYFQSRTSWKNIVAAFSPCGDMMGALHMLPYRASFFGREKRCALVAGVSTLERYRNKGVAAALMRFAEKRMLADGVLAATLQPFNFEFYQKFNYSVFVQRREYEWKGVNSERAVLNTNRIEPERMLDIYRSFMRDQNGFSIRTEQECRLLIEEFQTCGGMAAMLGNAYALGERLEGGVIHIAELAGQRSDAMALINALKTGCTRVFAPWPLNREGLEGARESHKPFNMIKILSAGAFFNDIPVKSAEQLTAEETLYAFERY